MIQCRFHTGDLNLENGGELTENLFQALADLLGVQGFPPVLDDENDMIVEAVDRMSAAVKVVSGFSGHGSSLYSKILRVCDALVTSAFRNILYTGSAVAGQDGDAIRTVLIILLPTCKMRYNTYFLPPIDQ